MKTVYRVEDKNNQYGPYWKNLNYSDMFPSLERHSRYNQRPGWLSGFKQSELWDFREDAEDNNQECVSGFANIRDVYKWFGGLIPQFYKKSKLRIVKYTVKDEDVLTSTLGNQIIFRRPKKQI
jgi:hypothetical protein